jgi:hypothetical protein
MCGDPAEFKTSLPNCTNAYRKTVSKHFRATNSPLPVESNKLKTRKRRLKMEIQKPDWSKKLGPNNSNQSPESSGKTDTELGEPNQTGPLSDSQKETPGSVEGRKDKATGKDKF